MKHYIFTLALSFFSFSFLAAQTDTIAAPQAEQMPYFVGCSQLTEGSVEKRNCSNQNLVRYIAENLKIPTESTETGSVYVSFYVSERGLVEDVTILRGLATPQNEAALRVVRNMPTWEPALLSGKPVKVKMTLPVRFVAQGDNDLSNAFQLTWGNLKSTYTNKKDLLQLVKTPITVRDESGNILEINELIFEKERSGKFEDAQARGAFANEDAEKLIKKLKSGDVFTVTATVQKKGQFFYVDKTVTIE